MTKAADDYESIARRLKELEADQQLALTGSSAPVHIQHDAATGETLEYRGGYGEYAAGWPTAAPVALVEWKRGPDRIWYASLTPNRING